jgi:hypothetical protein
MAGCLPVYQGMHAGQGQEANYTENRGRGSWASPLPSRPHAVSVLRDPREGLLVKAKSKGVFVCVYVQVCVCACVCACVCMCLSI